MFRRFKKIITKIALLAMIFSIFPQNVVKVHADPAPIDESSVPAVATLSYPYGLAVDSSNNIYVAGDDYFSKISPDGSKKDYTTITSGYGVSMDSSENLYVTNINGTVTKISKDGTIFTYTGFNVPYGAAVDRDGNLYVVNQNGNTIQKVSKSGKLLKTYSDLNLNSPYGIALDSSNNIYVADYGNHAVKKVSSEDGTIFKTYDGLAGPCGVAIDSDNNIYVAEKEGYSYDGGVKKLSQDGTVLAVYTGFGSLRGIALDKDKNIYVSDESNGCIKKIETQGVEITGFDAIRNVSAGNVGSTTYSNAAAVIAALPKTVKANNSAVTVPVSTWVNTDHYNPNAAGSYTFTATLGTIPAGYKNTGNYTATVEVVVSPAPAPESIQVSVTKLNPTAGNDERITLTAKDSHGNIDTQFNDLKNVTVSGYKAAPDGSYGNFAQCDPTAPSDVPVIGLANLKADSTTLGFYFENGVAYAYLALNNAAAQDIVFTVEGVDTPTTEPSTITPVPAAATSVSLTQDITAPASNGGQFVKQPQVTLKDQYLNICTNDNSTQVTASKKDTGTWTLTGTAAVAAKEGIVNFTDLGATNAAAVTGAQLAFNAASCTQITSSLVNLPAPEQTPGGTVTVAAGSVSGAIAGDSKITGLTIGNKYKVTVDGAVKYVKADGTLSDNESDAAALTGTEITGLTNGKTYKVEVYVQNGNTGSSGLSWQLVGNADISEGIMMYPGIAIAPDGTLYIVYSDKGNGSKATVMKYDNINKIWTAVGGGVVSAGEANCTTIDIDKDGVPYIGYTDMANGFKGTVMKYDSKSNSWKSVGKPGFTGSHLGYPTITIDKITGTPYIAFKTPSDKGGATVMKYDNTNDSWITVGDEDFTENEINSASIAIYNGVPYFAYADANKTYDDKATVMKYDGKSWVTVGNKDFSKGNAGMLIIAIDGNGVPYVSYEDTANDSKATVMKYDSETQNWVTVGSEGFSAERANSLSMAIDKDGTPYVVYEKIVGTNIKSVVMKYESGSWKTVGDPHISLYVSMAIDKNGVPYILSGDNANGYKATVEAYLPSQAGTVTLAAGSVTGAVAGDSKIVGLIIGNKYKVTVDGAVKYVKADGTLSDNESDAAALIGTEIIGLTNGKSYKVEAYVPSKVTVAAGSVSGATAGDSKVTGLTKGSKYKLTVDGAVKYVKADGTLSDNESDAAALIGTEIIGLTNGKSYKVEAYVPSKVTVAAGSVSGATAGDSKVTGLTIGNKYKVTVDGAVKYVKADGALSDNEADAAALTGTEIIGLTNGKSYKVEAYVPSKVTVAAGSVSGATAGDSKITGLTIGSKYKVTVDGAVKYVKADGTLSDNESDAAALTGTEIIGLINGKTYKVETYVPSQASKVTVAEGSVSEAVAGDSKITGLTKGNKYKVTVDGAVKYVKADGTLSDNEADAAALTGTEIIGLTNGKTYKVETYVPSQASKVTVAEDSVSEAVAGDSKITGLTKGSKYKVTVDGAVKYVKADGTLSDNESDAAALTGTEIIGLTNGKSYKVEAYVPSKVTVAAGSVSGATAGDSKVTGLTKGSKYKVTVDGAVKYVKADGTLSDNESDAAALTGTEIIGLTNGKTYKVEAYVPSQASKVTVAEGSVGEAVAGDSKITGLTKGNKYKVTVDGAVKYVKADGTLSDNEADAAALTGTEIIGLSNGKTYKVEAYVATPTPIPTPTPTETTTGTVVDPTTGKTVQGIETKVATETDGTKTVAVKSQQAIVLKTPDGNINPLTNISRLGFSSGENSNVTIASDGTIKIKNLSKGTEEKINVTIDLGNGQKVIIGKIDVKVSKNGDVSLTSSLIDPYGIITDSTTGKAINGANVTLYYANTDRNKSAGKTPDTAVQLPEIADFKPNSNKNPQVSDLTGAYGFMVYPTTDYYIVATKDGYNKYTSPTISVEQEIVKFDFSMNKIQDSTINPVTAEFDKNTSKQADLSIKMTLNGNTLTSIINGTKTLVNGTDYEVKDNVVTIKKSYLSQQSTGTSTFSFNFSTGNVQALAVTVKDTTSISSGGSSGGSSGSSSGEASTPVKAAVERIAGQNRVDTAIAIAKATYKDKVSKVILAASDNFPDALAGSVLAYNSKAPILLVGSSSEDQQKVVDYIKTNMDSTGIVYILGGTGGVGKDMETKVISNGFKNVTRIGGADRYETAAKISDTLGVKQGTPVVIVSGENYADAVSVSSIAARNQYPILMVRKDEMPEIIKKKLSVIKPNKIYVIGLEGSVSKEVENEAVKAAAIDKTNVTRIGGVNRFETSLDVAKYFNLSGNRVCIASGNNFPDALAGSSYASENNAPIMLVDENLSDNEISYLKNSKLSEVTIFGGESVVGKNIQQQISQIIGK